MGESADDIRSLVTRAKGGDRRALEDLLHEHQPYVYAICRSVTNNDADASDAMQDALVAISKALPKYEGTSSIRTWVYRISANAAIRQFNTRKRFQTAQIDETTTPAREVWMRQSTPEDTAISKISIDAALSSLPLEFREVISLRYLAGFSHAEIAEALSIPEGTVASRLARGRKILISELIGDENPAEDDLRSRYGTP